VCPETAQPLHGADAAGPLHLPKLPTSLDTLVSAPTGCNQSLFRCSLTGANVNVRAVQPWISGEVGAAIDGVGKTVIRIPPANTAKEIGAPGVDDR